MSYLTTPEQRLAAVDSIIAAIHGSFDANKNRDLDTDFATLDTAQFVKKHGTKIHYRCLNRILARSSMKTQVYIMGGRDGK